MRSSAFAGTPWARFTLCALLAPWLQVYAQSTASIAGRIIDQSGAVIAGVEIRASSRSIGVDRVAVTDALGVYQIAAVPVGDYRLEVRASGFHAQIVDRIRVEVGQRVTEDFQLRV